MRAVFFGTPEFGRIVLEKMVQTGIDVPLVVTRPDRRRRRGSGTEPSAVGAWAAGQGMAVAKPERVAAVAGRIGGLNPDVAVVAAYGQILPEELLALAEGRWLNVHASLLPAYRGAAPVTQAILDGRQETGVSIMEIVPELDAGPVVAARRLPIKEDETAGALSDRLARAGAELLVEILSDYVKGQIHAQPQPRAGVSVTRQLNKADGRIDWSRPAVELVRFIRAMHPWPGAWTSLDGTTVTVTAGRAGAGKATPGSFEKNPPLRVGTGRGLLEIRRLVPAGRTEMAGGAWLRGRRSGGRFG